MTYNPNIPQPSDPISQSQDPILKNFGQLNFLINVDHVQYTDPTVSSRGFHRKVSFSAPLTMFPVPPAPICILFTETITNQELVFQNSVSIKRLTGLTPASSGTDSATGGTYSAYVTPWGWIVHFGQTNPIAVNTGINSTLVPAFNFGATILYKGAQVFGAFPAGTSFTPQASSSNFNIQQGGPGAAGNRPLSWIVISI